MTRSLYYEYGEPSPLPHSFERRISEFARSTTYYVIAWVTTTKKTFYGGVKTFTTTN